MENRCGGRPLDRDVDLDAGSDFPSGSIPSHKNDNGRDR
jgi:hypothetical protein